MQRLALEPLERKAAKERKREHGNTAPGRKKNTSGKLPEVIGDSRDAIGKAVGLALEPLERKAAKERKLEGQKSGGRGKKKLAGKLPESFGDSRDAIGKAVGLSGESRQGSTGVEPTKNAEL